MASLVAPCRSLFNGFFSHASHHQQRRRISSLTQHRHWLSSASSALSKMWCVFVMWTLLSSVSYGSSGGGGGTSGMVKMSVAAADAAGAPADSVGSDSSSSSSSSLPSFIPIGSQCALEGSVYTDRRWTAYSLDKPFHRKTATVQFSIVYPVSQCCPKLLFYYDLQVKRLKQDMTCEEREKVLPRDSSQIIPLNPTQDGCRVENRKVKRKNVPHYVCSGHRVFMASTPRQLYFAFSQCGATKPSLGVGYEFNVTGYFGLCPSVQAYFLPVSAPAPAPSEVPVQVDPLSSTTTSSSTRPGGGDGGEGGPADEDESHVGLALGIVAVVALVAAIIFLLLWLRAKRRRARRSYNRDHDYDRADVDEQRYTPDPTQKQTAR